MLMLNNIVAAALAQLFTVVFHHLSIILDYDEDKIIDVICTIPITSVGTNKSESPK